MYLVYSQRTLETVGTYSTFGELHKRLPLPKGLAYRYVHKWKTADGREILTSDMTDAHLMNVVKYHFSANRVPAGFIFDELMFRGKLPDLADKIEPSEGYLSPTELATHIAKTKESDQIINTVAAEIERVIARYIRPEGK